MPGRSVSSWLILLQEEKKGLLLLALPWTAEPEPCTSHFLLSRFYILALLLHLAHPLGRTSRLFDTSLTFFAGFWLHWYILAHGNKNTAFGFLTSASPAVLLLSVGSFLPVAFGYTIDSGDFFETTLRSGSWGARNFENPRDCRCLEMTAGYYEFLELFLHHRITTHLENPGGNYLKSDSPPITEKGTVAFL